jgi:Gram-negative porin
VKSSAWFRSGSLGAVASIIAAVVLTPATARGELPSAEPLEIAKVKGWDITLDGRLSAFASVSHGSPPPKGYPNWQGFEDRPDASGQATATRIRSGFVSNYLGWSLHKEVNKDYSLSGRFALWTNISQKRDKTLAPDVDFREVYLKVDGPWGGVLAGRNIGLFGRGGINLDYDIEHAYGLGSPCMIINREPSQGPIAACGHVGFGILFPAFNAQLTYYTPNLAGLQLSVGLFDPATVQERGYMRTPFPRLEGELTYKAPKYFHAEVSGSWQRLGNQDNKVDPATGALKSLNVDSIGVAGSLGLNLGPVQIGGAGFAGKGLGIWAALENYPVFSDDVNNIIRAQKGFLGMAALNFGHTKIAGGVGETLISKVAGEPAVFLPGTNLNFPTSQFGISAGIYQGLLENLVLGLDFFRATTTWNPAPSPDDMTVIFTPKQTMNFVNLGATLVF